MNRYKLKYRWGRFNGTGTVTVTILGTTETHELSIASRRIGKYVRGTDQHPDEGRTYSLVAGEQFIGKNNLLAGVLLDTLVRGARVRALRQQLAKVAAGR
ncbi:MAG: hypothetical protein ACLQVX_23020 [Limisphaerales bacterium]